MEERIAVFGAGISGQAAARLAGREGAKVTLFDQKTEGANAIFEQADLDQFDRFVFSPGFAATHPWRLLVVGSGKPCYGEFSYAASKWKGPLIAITGTNGKTTTTELLRDALIAVGKSAHAVGNIGMPLSELICEGANDGETIAVCEVSSFQAELCAGLQVDALIWTNFSEDHLDRYESIEDYFRAKANLLGSLKEGAPFILGEDVQRLIESHGIRVAGAGSKAGPRRVLIIDG
ncbi:MAG: Mur ligase family protein [Verrucomicrobiota bacterium]